LRRNLWVMIVIKNKNKGYRTVIGAGFRYTFWNEKVFNMKVKVDGLGTVEVDVEVLVQERAKEFVLGLVNNFFESKRKTIEELISEKAISVMRDFISSDRMTELLTKSCEVFCEDISDILEEDDDFVGVLSTKCNDLVDNDDVNKALKAEITRYVNDDFDITQEDDIVEAIADKVKELIQENMTVSMLRLENEN